jgi:hypothetical protein
VKGKSIETKWAVPTVDQLLFFLCLASKKLASKKWGEWVISLILFDFVGGKKIHLGQNRVEK